MGERREQCPWCSEGGDTAVYLRSRYTRMGEMQERKDVTRML